MGYWTHHADVYIFLVKVWSFGMAYISFNIGPINTKLENVGNLDVLFLSLLSLPCLACLS